MNQKTRSFENIEKCRLVVMMCWLNSELAAKNKNRLFEINFKKFKALKSIRRVLI
jgi:hypothetical protein